MEDVAQVLERSFEELRRIFDFKEKKREEAFALSREIIRLSGEVTRSPSNSWRSFERALEGALRLREIVQGHPELESAGFVVQAGQELAEASMLLSLLGQRPFPTPSDLPISPQSYAGALGDLVGEVRRLALLELVEGREKKAQEYLTIMETLFGVLSRLHYPDALLDLRRKQDVARSLLERTRGEVTLASLLSRLERNLSSKESPDPVTQP